MYRYVGTGHRPAPAGGLEGYGLEIVENIAIEIEPNPFNAKYMKTKKDKMGHTLKRI